MPVRRIDPGDRIQSSQELAKLQQQLLDEWEGRPVEEPRPEITEEADRQGRVLRVAVVWDAWADVDANVRSEMIVNAFQDKYGDEAVMSLSIAMGLTTAEAQRIGRQ